jgi:hypothetical protein
MQEQDAQCNVVSRAEGALETACCHLYASFDRNQVDKSSIQRRRKQALRTSKAPSARDQKTIQR